MHPAVGVPSSPPRYWPAAHPARARRPPRIRCSPAGSGECRPARLRAAGRCRCGGRWCAGRRLAGRPLGLLGSRRIGRCGSRRNGGPTGMGGTGSGSGGRGGPSAGAARPALGPLSARGGSRSRPGRGARGRRQLRRWRCSVTSTTPLSPPRSRTTSTATARRSRRSRTAPTTKTAARRGRVVHGERGHGRPRVRAIGAVVWAEQYLRIPLEPPPAGSASGSSYSYTSGTSGRPTVRSTTPAPGTWTATAGTSSIVKWDPSNSKDNSQAATPGRLPRLLHARRRRGCGASISGRNIRAGAHYTQFVVYDFDGDGKAEVAVQDRPGTRDGTGAYLCKGPAANDDDAPDYRNGDGYMLSGPEYLTVFAGATARSSRPCLRRAARARSTPGATTTATASIASSPAPAS